MPPRARPAAVLPLRRARLSPVLAARRARGIGGGAERRRRQQRRRRVPSARGEEVMCCLLGVLAARRGGAGEVFVRALGAKREGEGQGGRRAAASLLSLVSPLLSLFLSFSLVRDVRRGVGQTLLDVCFRRLGVRVGAPVMWRDVVPAPARPTVGQNALGPPYDDDAPDLPPPPPPRTKDSLLTPPPRCGRRTTRCTRRSRCSYGNVMSCHVM